MNSQICDWVVKNAEYDCVALLFNHFYNNYQPQ